jgi:hypothetical protein
MKSSLLKNLIMGIVGVIGAAFSEMEVFVPMYVVLVTVIYTGQYAVKNWLMPSISDKLSIDIRDIVSGALSALFMGISVYAASLLTEVEFTWLALWKAVSIAVVGYFTKTVPSAKK